MAFPSVAGHGNLPNGNFSPTIFSKKAQLAFRKESVVEAITNTDYIGEINEHGDTVRIIKEPAITTGAYKRGQQVNPQDLDDEELTLVVDQANYFAFKIDDIEKRHSHIGWTDLASNRAGYELKDDMDVHVLNYMKDQIPAAQLYGTQADPQNVDFAGSNPTPVQVINRLARMLDVNKVPKDNRWLVVDPYFTELLRDENSKLLDQDIANDGKTILRNGMVTSGEVYRFKLYESLNLPIEGTGPNGSGTNGGYILAGHMSSTALASQINKTESYRDPDSFADVVRGLHMFGRKVLRTEAIVGSLWQTG